MNVIQRAEQAHAQVVHWRESGQRIGLVPTMGALHQGHLSLVRRSLAECQRTVVTIFVNPTQFGPHEDFARYPRTLDDDLAALQALNVDVVFAPSQEMLYPAGYSTYVQPPAAAQPLEGEFRPGHFRGVTTVVLKLFQILPATIAYFGQKDYQQLTVIRRMVEDLNVAIRVQGCQTVREADGLAMSSRNRYLNDEQRHRALCLWQSLQLVQSLVESGQRQVPALEAAMQASLRAGGADQIDYARIVEAGSLSDIETLDAPAVALAAIRLGPTRLIDNLLLDGPF